MPQAQKTHMDPAISRRQDDPSIPITTTGDKYGSYKFTPTKQKPKVATAGGGKPPPDDPGNKNKKTTGGEKDPRKYGPSGGKGPKGPKEPDTGIVHRPKGKKPNPMEPYNPYPRKEYPKDIGRGSTPNTNQYPPYVNPSVGKGYSTRPPTDPKSIVDSRAPYKFDPRTTPSERSHPRSDQFHDNTRPY